MSQVTTDLPSRACVWISLATFFEPPGRCLLGTGVLRKSPVTTITRRLGTSQGGDTQEEGGTSFLGVSVLGAMRPAAWSSQNRAAYLAINGKDLRTNL